LIRVLTSQKLFTYLYLLAGKKLRVMALRRICLKNFMSLQLFFKFLGRGEDLGLLGLLRASLAAQDLHGVPLFDLGLD
jgi:hypothetical protein